MHQSGAESFGAGPRLGTAAVDVDAVYVGSQECCCAGDLEGGVDAELGDCWGWVGGGGEVWGGCC